MPPKNLLPTLAAVVLAAAIMTGCAGAQKAQNPIPGEMLEMDPMLVKAKLDGEGDVKETIVLDSSQLFENATRDFKRRQYDRAIEGYAQILEHFTESKFYLPSLYNSGLAFERLGRHKDAIVIYEKVIAHSPEKGEATDAMYRMAECHANLGQWSEVVAMTVRIVERPDLSPYDLIEAWSRRGDALAELDKLSEAEAAYREALKIAGRSKGEEAVPKDSHFVASAQFGVSRIYHRLFSRVKFVLPVERMESDLEDKVQLFMQAQSNYIRTMRRGNPYWATAAGFHIGKMYEDFYTALLEAEIPDDLTTEEVDVYFGELRKEIKPLMERAMQIYEKNIIMSERYGITNDFTEKTQDSLERLKRYIIDADLQARDEKKIKKGESIELPGKPSEDEEKPKEADEG